MKLVLIAVVMGDLILNVFKKVSSNEISREEDSLSYQVPRKRTSR
jgi:hypothetical protein